MFSLVKPGWAVGRVGELVLARASRGKLIALTNFKDDDDEDQDEVTAPKLQDFCVPS